MKNIFTVLLTVLLIPYLMGQGKDDMVSDDKILELYSDLRVADVSDGMDMAGLREVGRMNP